MTCHAFSASFAAQVEPGEDPEVVRAKYFFRDEFLVSIQVQIKAFVVKVFLVCRPT